MSAITISREIGSQGDWIAQETAIRLGYKLVTKQTLEKIFLQYGFVDFKEKYDVSGFWERFDPQVSEMVTMLNQIIQALAAHGKVVLVGRGGFAMLKNFTDVLNVRIQAPITLRIERIMHDQKLSDISTAEATLKESDRVRLNFLQAAYGLRWNTASSFDLVIDTGKVSTEIAVEWLVDSLLRMENQVRMPPPTTAELKNDPVMANAISETLAHLDISR